MTIRYKCLKSLRSETKSREELSKDPGILLYFEYNVKYWSFHYRELLGIKSVEKDWVVVGATPQMLEEKGFTKVGKDFPVFIHPKSKEEYALARTERKKGKGYYGFVCDFNQKVTLEEDLLRRDITINAMAKDDHGKIIDPYHGQKDLEARLIRHVSPAFIEDPVRVLRVARFMARFKHLGFRLADETRYLIYQMGLNGELASLVPERIWKEWCLSLSARSPVYFITTLRETGTLSIILPELNPLFGIANDPAFLPEVDSGIWSLKALQAACKLTRDPIIRFACLMSLVGQVKTPFAAWPDHSDAGVEAKSILAGLCKRLRIPKGYSFLAQAVAQNLWSVKEFSSLGAEAIVSVFEKTDAFRHPQRFEDMLLALKAIYQPTSLQKRLTQNEEKWRQALKLCRGVDVSPLVEKGFKGEKIKIELRNLRVNKLKLIL